MRGTVIAAGLLLSGCGANPAMNINPASQPMINMVQVVPAAPPGATVIKQRVHGSDCKLKLWDETPTEEGALEQLRMNVAAVGGDAVTDITYEDYPTDLLRNCWATKTAFGTALKLPE